MPKTRPLYPPEFKAEAVKLAHSSGKLLSGLARDLGVSTETLRNWLKQEQIDTGKREGITIDEREELGRLRRENRILKEEREVLRKTTAFFSRHHVFAYVGRIRLSGLRVRRLLPKARRWPLI